jgi:hypothetical protein
VRALIAAGALLVALSGCLPAGPTDTAETPTSSDGPETGSEEETPSPAIQEEELADDVLFRITATATGPGGTVAELVEVVHVPRATTPADEAALDAGLCDAWRDFSDPQVLDAQLSATATSGTWPANSLMFMYLGQWSLFEGDYTDFMAYCAPALLYVPGTVSGRQVVSGTDPDSGDGWATKSYGFSVAVDDYVHEPGPDEVVLSDCRLELGPAAATTTSTLVQSWPGQVQEFPAFLCVFGRPD